MAITTIDQIHNIWNLCFDAYMRLGNKRLTFPEHTDPTKTYQWRYLASLCTKFNDWMLTDDERKLFIEIAVEYAIKRRLLAKGLSIFHQSNIINACYDKMRSTEQLITSTTTLLSNTHRWLSSQCDNNTICDVLLHQQSIGGFQNIINWHRTGQLPTIYLSVSRSCGIALYKLSKIDQCARALLPTDFTLTATRMTLHSELGKQGLRIILQNDWR